MFIKFKCYCYAFQNPLFQQLMKAPQKFRSDFLDLPPKMQGKVLEILKRNGGDNFNADALLQPPKDDSSDSLLDINFEGEKAFESTSRRVPEFAPIFRLETTTARFRPIMPKNKFEILQSQKPVEEVTLQRVNSPLVRHREKTGLEEDAKNEGKSDEIFYTQPSVYNVILFVGENRTQTSHIQH